MGDSSDANLQLKKRARRRLVGAIAFAGLAAVVLPMVMDEEPKQQVQDVQIRIPSQERAAAQPAKAPAAAASAEKPGAPAEASAVAPPANETRSAPALPGKPPENPPGTSADKPEKPGEAPARATLSEPQRAAAILDGKSLAPVNGAPASDGQYLILIGAFSNPANVKQLQTKIGELGIKVYTETLDSPEGKKTRVRAGPFPNREAADRALDKMKRIGVNGQVAAKQ